MPDEPSGSDAPGLVEQYELPDSSFDPATDGPPQAAVAEPSAETPAETPDSRPRDEHGRFLPKAAEHPAPLLRRAESVGISAAEAGKMSTADLRLEVQAALIDKLADQRQQVASPERTPTEGPSQPARAETPAPAFDLGVDLKEYDEPIRKAFESLTAEVARLRSRESRLDQIEQFLHGQARQTFAQRADAAFSKHASVLGDGSHQDLDKSSGEYLRRVAVLEAVNRMGKNGKSLEANIDAAVKTLFGATPPPTKNGHVADREATPDEQTWINGAVARPTNRSGAPEPKGDKRATKAVAQMLKDRGIVEGDEADGIPD